jgi:hypothetical protein
MFRATSHIMIEYPHFHFGLIRVIDVQPNTTYFPNFFSSLLITVFPKVHGKSAVHIHHHTVAQQPFGPPRVISDCLSPGATDTMTVSFQHLTATMT